MPANTMWRVTETAIYDGDTESHSYLRKEKLKEVNDPDYMLTCVRVSMTEVRLDELLQFIESDLENWNYHSMIHLPGLIVESVTKRSSADVAKRVLWDLRDKFMGG